ncbi:hypothetical protein FA15DRAFT_588863 [Coprinopsis marcescibilis]|uniref:Sulfhydryl oxidase n=1 Tax=Coprinopsis marcescibilis TaxID=230819 RepID=A0A5C3L0J7_COPMA|nr:hypothetical protein FA15DRAFT_588863 [Coprinopsis marcescibilis]
MAVAAGTTSSSSSDGQPKTPLPPGMVMGPDGKPCKICTAFRNWKPGTTDNIQPDTQREKARTAATARQASGQKRAATGAGNEPPADCPPDVEVLGRATWTFLHTAAAYYPEKPSPNQRANMLMLIRSLPVVYPCAWCAQDFGKCIAHSPPDVSSREKLSLWLCQRHNEVNEKLGKEMFDCAQVDERWKDGPADGRCD